MINKREKKFLNDNCIDIKKFLMCYCNIYSDEILQSKLNHKDIKKLFPQLKRYSINYTLCNTNGIYTGDIVLVKDSYKNIAPYENPKIKEYSSVVYEENVTTTKKGTNNSITITEDLSIYELRMLCQELKRQNRMNGYHRIHREYVRKIEEENPNVDKYKVKKIELSLKARKQNDEY